MKFRKSIFSVLSIAFALIFTFVLVSCGKEKVKEKKELAMVNSETIAYDGENLTWGSVLNAENYEVVINDITYNASESPMATVQKQDITVKIRALASDSNPDFKSCSNYAEKSFTYKGQINVKLDKENRGFSWDAVDGCKGYQVSENDSIYQGFIQDTFYGVVSTENEDGNSTSKFKVKAVFEDKTCFTLWSETKTVTVLSKPKNVFYDGNKITWDKVPNATYYTVAVRGTKADGTQYIVFSEKSTDNVFVFNAMGDDYGTTPDYLQSPIVEGSFSVEITACSDSEDVLNSLTNTYGFSYVNPIEVINVNAEGLVTWPKVTNADYYLIEVDGVVLNTRIYANTYDLGKSAEIRLIPQKEDGTLYSTWSGLATIVSAESPTLTWVNPGNSIQAGYLDWSVKADGTTYNSDDVTFSLTVYNVFGDSIEEFVYEPVYSKTTPSVTMSYSEISKYMGAKGDKVAVEVNASVKGKATSKASNRIFFYNVKDPSYMTESSNPNYTTSIKISIDLNDVQIAEAFKNFDITPLYKVGIASDGYDGDYKWTSETAATAETHREIEINTTDISSKEILVKLSVDSVNNRMLLKDEAGNQCVFVFPEEEYKVTFTQLAMSELSVSNSILSWNRISNASGYFVKVCDLEGNLVKNTPIVANEFNLAELEAGKYVVSVAAMGNGNLMLSSAYTAPKNVEKLAAPTNLRVVDVDSYTRKITWDIVDCDGYELYVGVHTYSKDELGDANEIIISSDELSIAGTQVNVRAIGTSDKITSGLSNTIVLYKLPTPKNVVYSDLSLSWDSVSNVSNSKIGYIVYNDGNAISGILTETSYDLYDYALLKTNESVPLTLSVRAVLVKADGTLDTSDANLTYFHSDMSPTRTFQRLASPTNVKMNQYTGEITWDGNLADSKSVTGYKVTVEYKNSVALNHDYYVTTSSLIPDLSPIDGEEVTITVVALGNHSTTLSSNPFLATEADYEAYGDRANKIGCVAKLQTLNVLPDNSTFLSYKVDEKNDITVIIDEDAISSKSDATIAASYGVSIDGVQTVVRRFFPSEELYTAVTEKAGFFRYDVSTKSYVEYDAANNTYYYVSRYNAAGVYEIDVCLIGGNYKDNPNTFYNTTTCYLSSDYTGVTQTVIILGQLSRQVISVNAAQTAITFNNYKNAVSYEYKIIYKSTGGDAVGAPVTGTINAATGDTTSIDISKPAGATSVEISIRVLGDSTTIFSSLYWTKTELLFSNSK